MERAKLIIIIAIFALVAAVMHAGRTSASSDPTLEQIGAYKTWKRIDAKPIVKQETFVINGAAFTIDAGAGFI